MDFTDLNIKYRHELTRQATTCPKCSADRKKKTDRCLTVNNEPGNRWYHCNHCDWSGNLDTMEIYSKVKEKSGMPDQQRELSMEIRKYFDRRGIPMHILRRLKVYEYTNKKGTLIGWPVMMDMTLVNVKFLNPRATKDNKILKWFQISKEEGTRIIPIGMHLLKTHDEDGNIIPNNILTITEGEIEMATWLSCGYENIISVPDGAPNPNTKNFKDKFAWTNDPYVKSKIALFKTIYIASDNDENGEFLAEQLGILFGKGKCRKILFPKGYKDSNEVYWGDEKKGLKALGKEVLDNCYKNPVAFPIKGIIKASQVSQGLKKIREKGYEPGLMIGIPEVDEKFTMKRKLLYEFVGIPSAGKSTWVLWYLVKLVQSNPDKELKFAIFPPENRPVERVFAKIAEALTQQNIEKDAYNAMSDEVYRKAMIFIEKHFFIIHPDKENFENFGKKNLTKDKINTLDSIFEYVAYLKLTENIFGFVIDPINKVEVEKPKNVSDTDFVGQILDRIIYFSEYYDLAAMLIIHPTKTESIGMNFKMPNLYSAKGSSAYFERADVGVIVHRNMMKKKKDFDLPTNANEEDKWEVDYYAPTIIKCEKIKFEEIGKPGMLKMKYRNNQFEVFDGLKNTKKAKPIAEKKEKVVHSDLFSEGGVFSDDDEIDELPF
jgi:twinkle protein